MRQPTSEQAVSEPSSAGMNSSSYHSSNMLHKKYIPCFDDPDYSQQEYEHEEHQNIYENHAEEEASGNLCHSPEASLSSSSFPTALHKPEVLPSSSTSAKKIGHSGGRLHNEIFVDEHLGNALKMSASINPEQNARNGPRDHYREALIEADINHIRSVCITRGIDPCGHSRNILIEKLLNSFSFLK